MKHSEGPERGKGSPSAQSTRQPPRPGPDLQAPEASRVSEGAGEAGTAQPSQQRGVALRPGGPHPPAGRPRAPRSRPGGGAGAEAGSLPWGPWGLGGLRDRALGGCVQPSPGPRPASGRSRCPWTHPRHEGGGQEPQGCRKEWAELPRGPRPGKQSGCRRVPSRPPRRRPGGEGAGDFCLLCFALLLSTTNKGYFLIPGKKTCRKGTVPTGLLAWGPTPPPAGPRATRALGP